MLVTLTSTIVLLLALMMAWILVQRAARAVAAQHPEAGPLRLIGGGCGGQGHGHDAAPSPLPHHAGADGDIRLAAGASAAAPAEGCAACANTACKPGTPTAFGAPSSCPSTARLHRLLQDSLPQDPLPQV